MSLPGSVSAAQPTGIVLPSTGASTHINPSLTTSANVASISFGRSVPATVTTGLNLGTTATSALGLLPPAPITATQGTGLSLNNPSSVPSLGLSLASTTTSAPINTVSLTLGTLGAASKPASFQFSTGLGTPVTTSATTGLTLGGPGLPTSTTSTSSTTFSGFSGLGTGYGATSNRLAATITLGLGNTAATRTSVGLGGIDTSQTSTGLTASSGVAKGDGKVAKETLLPIEIFRSTEEFKKYVKDQKGVSSDIARMSSKSLLKVQEETDALRQLLAVISNGLQRNAALIEKLKQEAAQELHHAEIAQRTKDTPPGLQYENTAPHDYFTQLVAGFEGQMQCYRQQIEETERHLLALARPTALSPNELTQAMQQLHDTFITMAGRLQTIDKAVKTQKEQYLNYRKYFLGETTNIFKTMKKSPVKSLPKSTNNASVTVGPTPFTGMNDQTALAMTAALNRTQQPTGGGPPMLGLTAAPPSVLPGLGFGTNLLGTSSGAFTPQPLPVENKPFQLHKPPLGHKRGKR